MLVDTVLAAGGYGRDQMHGIQGLWSVVNVEDQVNRDKYRFHD
jgi:hypothetical protein